MHHFDHELAAIRVLAYLKSTKNVKIVYDKFAQESLYGYADADWAADLDTRKSTSGIVFLLAGGAVLRRSMRQTCVALSNTEAEYVATSLASREEVWIGNHALQIAGIPWMPITLFNDNRGSLLMAQNAGTSKCAKHIDIQYHFIKQQILSGVIYCPTEEMVPDVLTKSLPAGPFIKLRGMMGIFCFKHDDEGGTS